jgi:hypothetical protein
VLYKWPLQTGLYVGSFLKRAGGFNWFGIQDLHIVPNASHLAHYALCKIFIKYTDYVS